MHLSERVSSIGVALVMAFAAHAEDLTVPAGTETNFVSKATFGSLRVEGGVTVSKVNVTATNIVLAGGTALATGKSAQFGTTALKEPAKDCVFTNNTAGVYGRVAAAASGNLYLGYVKLYADPEIVQSDDGYLDFLSLSNATMKTRRLYNYTSLTGRVTVAGSCTISHPGDGYDNNPIFQTGAFGVVLQDNAKLTFAYGNQKAKLAGPSLPIRFTGLGDVKISSGTDKNNYQFDIFPKTVFGHQGKLTLTAVSYGHTTYQFPKSYTFGSNLTELNIAGYNSSWLTYVDVVGGATLTLPPKTTGSNSYLLGAGTVRLDATDQDVSFTGEMESGAQLTLEKIGEHEATVSAARLANLLVKEGTLRLTKTCNLERSVKTTGDGKIVVDGCTLYLNDGFGIGSKIETVNGGVVIKKSDGVFTGHPDAEGRFSLGKTLHVQEGTFNFSLNGCPAKRWRLVLKKLKNAATANNWFPLNRIWLFDADGNRVGSDLVYLSQGSQISKGKVQLVATTTLTHYGTSSWNDLKCLAYLFTKGQVSSGQNNYPNLTKLSQNISLDNSESWVSIEWWLNDTANPVTGYNLGYYESGKYPTDWDLCIWDDDTSAWVTVDQRRSIAPTKDQGQNYMNGTLMSTYYSNGSAPPAEFFRLNAYTRPGLNAADAPTVVRVDSGATLDYSAFTSGTATVEEIVLSTAGGGTLTGGALAAAGTLSVPDAVTGEVSIPLDLEGMSGLENIEKWTVKAFGTELKDIHPSYDAENKRIGFEVSYLHLTENAEGDLFKDLTGSQWIVEVDPGVVCTNTSALSGSMGILKTGGGTLVMGATSAGYDGTISVGEGLLLGLVSNAFGTGTVSVTCSTTATSQVRIGSTTADTAYDNDFVFVGDSSDSYPALWFITSGRKKTAVNGSVTASGYLAVTDSGKADSQMDELVSFSGPVTVVGQTLSYPADNRVRFVGKVTVAKLRGVTYHPRMGRFELASDKNDIGEIELDYIGCWVSSAGALGGAALRSSGANDEENRGSFIAYGNQTVGWIEQDSRTVAVKKYSLSSSDSAPATLTLTGGTSVARCQFALNDGAKAAAKLSCIVDAGNDDFVQIFSNSTWTASGDLIVSNGTLRLAGTATAAQMRSLTVAGGAFELDSTADNALGSVETIAVGAGARLRVSKFSATTFAPDPVLKMEKNGEDLPTIELPDGVAMTVKRASLGAKTLGPRTYTGAGGSGGTVVPWISGSGTLTVEVGRGLQVIIR